MPFALIVTAVVPVHTTFTLALIHPVIALVAIARLPLEDTEPVLHVIPELPIILVAVRPAIFLPLAGSILEAIGEVTDIGSAIPPAVCAEAMWLAEFVLTDVCVTLLEPVVTFAVFQTVNEFTLISVAILPLMHTVAVALAVLPFADIRLSGCAFPDAEPLLDSFLPLAIVHFTVFISENAFTMRLVVMVLAEEGRTVRK